MAVPVGWPKNGLDRIRDHVDPSMYGHAHNEKRVGDCSLINP